jgi:hypothetical protein
MSYVTDPAPPSRWSVLRVFRLPIIVLTLCVPLVVLPFVWNTFRLPEEGLLPVNMMAHLAVMIAIILLAIWWTFFSGVRWVVRFAVIAFVMLGAVGFYFTIRKTEMTTHSAGLVPIFHFVWETTPEDRLKQHLQQEEGKKDAQPAIDATAASDDFPRFRGPNADGVVPIKLEADWTKYPP